VTIPIKCSVANHALFENDMLIINDVADRPDLARLSRGNYHSASFAVVRVPLFAQGQAVGVLTVTERQGQSEFSAHDQKLLEGISAMGASSLLNCRLHAAVKRQMLCTIKAMVAVVDAKDHYTHDHSGRVSQLCVMTAAALGIDEPQQLHELELAALLHDVGKIGVPDALLDKKTALSMSEFEQVKAHCEIGARILQHVPGLENVAKAILHHHERYDGLGYPYGLSRNDIPLASRLIAVADSFDALTSDRPYRKAVATEEALRELQLGKETQFDPDIVDVFISAVNEKPLATVPAAMV